MPNTVTSERKLTSKQEAFAVHYASNGGNALQAARSAGYSESTALVNSHQWLENSRIQQAVDAHRQATSISADELQVTPAVITRGLFKEAQTAETGSARVAAWRTLADIHGMMSGGQQQLPEALGGFLRALAGQPARGQLGDTRVHVHAREVDEGGGTT